MATLRCVQECDGPPCRLAEGAGLALFTGPPFISMESRGLAVLLVLESVSVAGGLRPLVLPDTV
jgi:hypothetical protein